MFPNDMLSRHPEVNAKAPREPSKYIPAQHSVVCVLRLWPLLPKF